MTFATSHPGKHGDALYALPAIRALAQKYNVKCDFYTSSYCEPLRDLFMAQECINNFYVAPNYEIQRMDMGVQPWYVPIDANCYGAIHHLGFQNVPDIDIPGYIAREAGVTAGPIHYDVPSGMPFWDDFLERVNLKKYYVLAPRGMTDYLEVFRQVVRWSQIPAVIVGSESDVDYFRNQETGRGIENALLEPVSYLETAYIMSRSQGFVGLMSSQLVLANGFNIPKVVPHDGKSWDMRHVVRNEYIEYPILPTANEILELLETLS